MSAGGRQRTIGEWNRVADGNTYTIQGLKVPELEADIAAIREELTSLRTLFNAAVDAITRIDADIAALLDTHGAAG